MLLLVSEKRKKQAINMADKYKKLSNLGTDLLKKYVPPGLYQQVFILNFSMDWFWSSFDMMRLLLWDHESIQ